VRYAWIARAAALPSAAAFTTSLPPLRQSPPAYQPLRPVRAVLVRRRLGPSSTTTPGMDASSVPSFDCPIATSTRSASSDEVAARRWASCSHRGVRSACAGPLPSPSKPTGWALPLPHDALDLRGLPLVRVAAHLLLDAAVEHRHVGDAEAARLAHHVERRVAAADDDAAPVTTRDRDLPSFMRSIHVDGAHDVAGQLLAGDTEPGVRAEPEADEHRVVVLLEVLEARRHRPPGHAGLHLDAADAQHPLDLLDARGRRASCSGATPVVLRPPMAVALLVDRARGGRGAAARAPRRGSRGPRPRGATCLARVGAGLEEARAGREGDVGRDSAGACRSGSAPRPCSL
jgi:hypothetical protein